MFARGAYAENNPVSALQGQRALALAIIFGVILLAITLIVVFMSRTPQDVAMLESSLIKGFGSALDSSDINPVKKDSKKAEVRT